MKWPFSSICLALLVLGTTSFFLWQQKASTVQSQRSSPVPASQEEQEPDASNIDLTSRKLDLIPVGTVIGKSPPSGWSHLVLITIPTLVAEDERDAPPIATHYARMLKFTVLANVVRSQESGPGPFRLERVARGFAITIKGQETIVNSQNTLGADLGWFGRPILKENENILDNDVRQIARTDTMLVFDARSVMRRGDNHVNMIMRHAILVDPATGRLYTLVWLLTDAYEAAEDTMQLLPEGMWEKRYLSVKRDKFNALGIPTREAFALRQVPQGTPVPYSSRLKEEATAQKFTRTSVHSIEDTLRAAAIQASGR